MNWSFALALALLGAAAILFAATGGGRQSWIPDAAPADGSASPRSSPTGNAPRPTPPPVPPRTPFRFRLVGVTTSPAEPGKGQPAGRSAGREIRSTLSGLYDRAFVDPASWEGPVPESVWEAFAPQVRPLARRDVASFTMPDVRGTLAAFEVERSSLSVQVLVAPDGRAAAAFAGLTFVAHAELVGGDGVLVWNEATLLLRPIEGEWLIAAYPQAESRTQRLSQRPVDPVPAPRPAPLPSQSGGGR
jgi:hypothetical protein